MNKRRRLPVLWLAGLFGFGIALLSVVPVNRIALGTRPHYFASPGAVHHAAVLHAVVHVLIFGIAAVVAWFATEISPQNSVKTKTIAVLLTMLLAFGTEWLQHIIYHQPLEWSDVSTNLNRQHRGFCSAGCVIPHSSIKRKVVDRSNPSRSYCRRFPFAINGSDEVI